ncbi:MurR/RpiR family transcriptional regulator [Gammaproteobacteria bacterium]|jgi:RpiR family carbohydrate utilization transcriptional regulator|nr:MurR/RpiR family transcriptional regulator [Gammaproteobacteria bacterium]MDA7851380.1 MurR/RpiR family transcriptional regulator [Gammaproteobacteria bacterium]MDA8955611.1 MurR/RpiR family transcriptional regulator [Gammaproteobacteria bacterium]MDA9102493.1 MurR/RpiR family transcriptional regulator [Gammaproteobacteria bacterium]MDA9342880.1 MurR/RpiR family transcriptional regulator [Gammaproteobacteria bacterium]
MPTKLLRHIKNTLPDLRKSEKIVGEFILADPKSIITMKTAEASSAMGISEPTLIRFCKALGFTGYQELKINLSQQLAADDYFVMYEIDQNDTIHELCEKVFDTTISEILNVRSQIDQNVLSDAIEILANAGRVEFYAFGGSAPVAMDGQHKFFRLKIPSSYISDPHIQFMSANSLGKDDVVVVISQSGTTSALIDSVKIVRKSGVKVIGIMPGNTPLASICDYPLVINIGDNNRISKPHTSRIAYTAVIDVLTMGVAQLKPEAQDHLYNIADSQRSLRVKE